MCSVEWKKLGDVCDFIRGPFGGALKKEMFVKEGYAIYEQQHAIYGDWVFRYFINDDKFHQLKRFEVKAGDILMSCSGTMGKTSIVPENPTKGIINQALLKLSVRDIATNKFVKAFMDSSWFQKGLGQNTSGGAIQNVASVSILKTLEIPIPSLSKQQEIVSHLDTFTSLISNLESELDMRRKQYEHYRNQLLDFEGVEGVEWKTLGETCTLKARIGWQGLTKKEYRDKGDYLLVTGTDFTDAHTIDFEHCVYVDKERYEQDINIQLKNGDVLITKDGTLGKVAYINSLPKPTTLNGGVFVVRDTTSKISQKYLMYYLVSGYFKHFIEHNHTNGTIKHLTQGLLVNFTIPIPSKQTQQEIVEKLDAFENLIQSLEQEIKLRKQQYEYYREKLLTFEKE